MTILRKGFKIIRKVIEMKDIYQLRERRAILKEWRAYELAKKPKPNRFDPHLVIVLNNRINELDWMAEGQ